MWVAKLVISPGKFVFPKLAFLFILGRPCRLIWCPVGGLVGGCGARAVSRKTPIYFMIIIRDKMVSMVEMVIMVKMVIMVEIRQFRL